MGTFLHISTSNVQVSVCIDTHSCVQVCTSVKSLFFCQAYAGVLCGIECTTSSDLSGCPSAGVKGGLGVQALACIGVQGRRKFPWGWGAYSLRNGKWKTCEIKKKNRWRVPGGTVSEKREWMRLLRCGESEVGPKDDNLQVKQRREALDWTDILNLLCSFWSIVWPWLIY